MHTFILDNTYLLNFKDLEEKASAMIGRMNEGSYKEFSEKMLKVATEAGIVNPKMAIRQDYKGMEKVHLLDSERRWDLYKEDAETLNRKLGQEIPKVFVIDGSKFKVMF